MNRQRTILLIVCLIFFVAFSALIIQRRLEYRRTHFAVGAIPQEIVNQLLPKVRPLESLHPPALRFTDPIRYGNATSVLSVIEFGDFECSYCRDLAPIIKKTIGSYEGRVRFVWRDFPIEEVHDEAMPAAIFTRCAGQQGKFWETYDALMSDVELGDRTYRDIATSLNLNRDLLNDCRANPATEAAIKRDRDEARADGIQSAPFLFVGTKAIDGFVDADTLKKAIDDALSSL